MPDKLKIIKGITNAIFWHIFPVLYDNCKVGFEVESPIPYFIVVYKSVACPWPHSGIIFSNLKKVDNHSGGASQKN